MTTISHEDTYKNGRYESVYVGEALSYFFSKHDGFGLRSMCSIDSLLKIKDITPLTLLMDDLVMVKKGYMLRDTIEYLVKIHCKIYSSEYGDYGGDYVYITDLMDEAFNDEIPALKVFHDFKFIFQEIALEKELIEEPGTTLTNINEYLDLFNEYVPNSVHVKFYDEIWKIESYKKSEVNDDIRADLLNPIIIDDMIAEYLLVEEIYGHILNFTNEELSIYKTLLEDIDSNSLVKFAGKQT